MSKLTLVIPAFSYGPALERTWESCQHVCDDLVIISTAFWEKDLDAMRKLTPKVVVLDWNYTMLNGFGEMMNRGTGDAKNEWCLLLGVGETFEKEHLPFLENVNGAPKRSVMFCDHEGDKHQWGRIWNKNSDCHWSGYIHESIIGKPGMPQFVHGPTVFRMRDTHKEPREDIYEQKALEFLKPILYHWQYKRLRETRWLGGTDPGWLGFVDGSKEANDDFIAKHRPMIDCVISGDLGGFLNLVKEAVDAEQKPTGCNYNPLGEAMSEGA